MNTHNNPLVLMADDDDDDCTLAKDAYRLSKAPGALECVEDGIQLMEFLFRSDPLPAVILLDLNMPRKDGRQALREIKGTPGLQTIPIVILTTSREKEDMAYTSEMRADAFFTKPAAFSEWVAIMETLAGRWLAGMKE